MRGPLPHDPFGYGPLEGREESLDGVSENIAPVVEIKRNRPVTDDDLDMLVRDLGKGDDD